MGLRSILSNEQIRDYHEKWKKFSDKHVLESAYNVHSGKPVIGKPMRYGKEKIFRGHVFLDKLREIDPYFIANKYIHPFWHAQHYFVVMEQMYHAGSNLIRDNSKLIGKDVPEKFNWARSLFWQDRGMSVELMLEDAGKRRGLDVEKGHFTFYDKGNRRLSQVSVLTYWDERSYIKDMEDIRSGVDGAKDELIRKIECQEINHGKLLHPRLCRSSKDYLISEIRQGRVPSDNIHDFFSFWDKNS